MSWKKAIWGSQYHIVSNVEEDREPVLVASKRHLSVLNVLVLLISVTGGFVAGVWVSKPHERMPTLGRVPLGSVTTHFTYNMTYALPPSKESNQAWENLVPDGFGFVFHPVLSTEPAGLAMFHQLHCLNSLRVQYYKALETLNNSAVFDAGEEGHYEQEMRKSRSMTEDPGAAHARHCFDYLRQSLMCAADANLEPILHDLGGVSGWGHERTCRDYEALMQWAKKWNIAEENHAL